MLALLAAAPLAACGFTPAYGPNGPAKALRGRISYQEPTDPNAFELVKQLEVQFGRPEAPTYALRYGLTVSAQAGGYTTANAITRYVLNGSVVWSLDDIASTHGVSPSQIAIAWLIAPSHRRRSSCAWMRPAS